MGIFEWAAVIVTMMILGGIEIKLERIATALERKETSNYDR